MTKVLLLAASAIEFPAGAVLASESAVGNEVTFV
jgi:hypothetical protein